MIIKLFCIIIITPYLSFNLEQGTEESSFVAVPLCLQFAVVCGLYECVRGLRVCMLLYVVCPWARTNGQKTGEKPPHGYSLYVIIVS